jgi:glycosyltransferase involved in cell wall biosynthesis
VSKKNIIKTSPRVSVVIPTYNYAKFIAETIESVLNQTYTSYEIIVIDDGSTDNTPEVLEPYQEFIRYIYQENQSISAARNHGILLAKGEFIIFLDADDFFLPQILEKEVAVFDAQPDLGIVISGWHIVNEEGKVISSIKMWDTLAQLDAATWVSWRPLLPSATMFRRQWLERVGGFDPESFPAEDIDCVLRMVVMGCESDWCRQIGVCYRQHGQTITHNTPRQAEAFERLYHRFFARRDLSCELRQIENNTRFYCLLWSAWRLYHTGYRQEMLQYLRKSLNYTIYSPAETITKWVEFFADNCLAIQGDRLNAYSLWQIPDWQKLIVSTLGMKQPRVSVIIPTYNNAGYLLEAIESVFTQTYNDYEIIVIDDGSTDNTREVLGPYQDQIRYVYQDNQGVAAARNRGIYLARGELIAFLDADDLYLPHKLAEQVAVFDAQPSLGMVVSGWQITNENGEIISDVKMWHSLPQLDLATWLLWKPVLPSATMIRRQWLERVNGFSSDTIPAEDTECFLHLVAMGCPADWCRNIGTIYRQINNQSLTQNTIRQAKSFELLYHRFFARTDLPPQIRKLENKIHEDGLVWSAWRFYHTEHEQEMLQYLRKSLQYTTFFPAEIVARWIKFFQDHCVQNNYQLDAYFLTQIPGWQELMVCALETKQPRVSVIIPTYNSAQYLPQAIESVLAQTYTDYEIIVINDGSTDNTRQVVAPYEEQIRYVYQENQGVSAARNRGLYLARGELIAFLDADDIFLPYKLKEQVAVFDAQPQVGIVNTGFRVIQEDGKTITDVKWWEEIPDLDQKTWVLYKPVLPSAMMFRCDWFERVGGFDSRFTVGEDIDVTFRMICQGCLAAWLPKVTVCYRQHNQSATKRNPPKLAKSTEEMLKNFFAQPDLPQSIRLLEKESLHGSLAWLAALLYHTGFTKEMTEYLYKSWKYTPRSWIQTIEHWLKIFGHSARMGGYTFDVYSLTQSKEWQQVVSALLICP